MSSHSTALATMAFCIALGACANRPSAAPPAVAADASTAVAPSDSSGRMVKARDGRYEGEIVGTPVAGGKFEKLQIGMTLDEVQDAIGAPNRLVRHETGKRWIPFYFGNDAQRLQTLYRGEGCLTFTGGNAFGGGGNELIRITYDRTETCTE